MKIFEEQHYKFLHTQIVHLTFLATLSRNKVYSPNATEKQKEEVRKSIKSELKVLSENYVNHSVDEQEHENNICYLAEKK